MQKTIYLSSRDDLTYLAGALIHGKYRTSSYEHQTIYEDENEENRLKFNIRFVIPEERTIEQIYAGF